MEDPVRRNETHVEYDWATDELNVFQGPDAEVTLVRVALERDGIRTAVRPANLAYRDRLRGVVSVVHAADLERARGVVARYLKGGLPSDAVLAQPWRCASCGEPIEGQFQACWKCGAARP